MLYPLKFRDVYKDYLWGGRTLAAIGKKLPEEGIVAESWEISAHPNGPSIVKNGKLAGITLTQVLEQHHAELLGQFDHEPYCSKFPLLIKFIDACDDLSVQVHPDDEQASRLEHGELGKNEMWYIVAAHTDSRLIIGTHNGIDREAFAQAVADDNISSCLREIAVKPGDIIDIPAGLLHAIGKGIVICEIQQNSDTTYRVYDYDRRDAKGNTRPLHIDKALEVINFSLGDSVIKQPTLRYSGDSSSDLIELLVLNEYFEVERWTVSTEIKCQDELKRFSTLTVLEGAGHIVWSQDDQEQYLEIIQGESVLMPALINNWKIEGDLVLLKASLPVYNGN